MGLAHGVDDASVHDVGADGAQQAGAATANDDDSEAFELLDDVLPWIGRRRRSYRRT